MFWFLAQIHFSPLLSSLQAGGGGVGVQYPPLFLESRISNSLFPSVGAADPRGASLRLMFYLRDGGQGCWFYERKKLELSETL